MADVQQIIDDTVAGIVNQVKFTAQYNTLECFRIAVNNKYKQIKEEDEKRKWLEKAADAGVSFKGLFKDWNPSNRYQGAAEEVYIKDFAYAQGQLALCLQKEYATKEQEATPQNPPESEEKPPVDGPGPFDRRLYRDFINYNNESQIKIPYSTQYKEAASSGLLVSNKYVKDQKIQKESEAIEALNKERERIANDTFYIGVPALINTYAITKLYGSEGGAKLVNKRGERRWYEVDQAFGMGATQLNNFASNPTTSTIISWGGADPYGRTPYHFSDFVFAKYWNKIENNRLITLRRFGAPILDNLKFPGMDGVTKLGTPGDDDGKGGTVDQGTTSKILFPPMAHAVTYFGEETGNKLSDLLKFTSGLKWDEAKSDVWPVEAQSTPDSQTGPGSLFKSLGSLSKMLAVAGGDFNPQLIMNSGNLPPDPYSQGPYENRILGPVNRIDSVKKRAPGLEFEWSGLNLQFEYVARPVGGVNPKAVLLDILSNFLVIGSASAVFFGGQHRFMGNPAKYPFLGGEKGIESWYAGKPLQWAGNTVDQFVGQVTNEDSDINKGGGEFFNQLLSGGGLKGIFGAVKGLFTGDSAIGKNLIVGKLAEKTAGQVPYLTGLKALLTGEPVGEWHVTIGNPLNPIAMIGNLICTGVEVEFGDELGPDDFPTEIKIVVKLDHGMPRDRDAIQSIFNRGMGRIYDLPDSMTGSADGQSVVDDYTMVSSETGTAAAIRGWLAGPSKLGGRSGPPVIKQPALSSDATSIWSRAPFAAVSPNGSVATTNGDIARSAYRGVDWLALKSLQ